MYGPPGYQPWASPPMPSPPQYYAPYGYAGSSSSTASLGPPPPPYAPYGGYVGSSGNSAPMPPTPPSAPPPKASLGYFGSSHQAAPSNTTQQAWWRWWSSTSEANRPPAHERPLYSNVPLPPADVDCEPKKQKRKSVEIAPECFNSSCSSSSEPFVDHSLAPSKPTHSKASKHDKKLHPIRLHPVLEHACQSSSPLSPSSKSGATLPANLADWVQEQDSPATMPSVGYLNMKINSTGKTIRVRPTSPASPHIVTVGDVFNALEEALKITDPKSGTRLSPKVGKKSKCIGERIARVLDSLQLWWRASDGTTAGPHPLQLVVGRR
ncbi:hypothetical protein H0H81_007316 [Sphagnurus paluster]|uniref:DUF6699 domain-containing protein n=1 Tax=Sphagnurus paluster TaxID=117069 RepID=A0A9P7K6P1_9AGAR|nr:hypothetical protein H0H81_007316 [Sphagnurus paluster]